MKAPLLLAAFVASLFIVSNNSYAQFWTEDFGTPASGTLANGYVTANGTWTVTNTGANGSEANVWYVSGEECGNNPGACGSVCTGGDASLHLGPSGTLGGDVGAAYAAGGLGFFFVETDKRAESPVIDCSGQTNITLAFNYIEDYVGQAGYDPGDDATLWYFDGATWTQIDPLAVTPAGCNPQGTWTTYSALLPASANNNPNVRIGFRWVNNDDNVGTDPSFAVDDITLTTTVGGPPVADFSTPTTTICEGDCIDFTDLSTLGTNPTWSWTFAGGTPGTSSAQNPVGVCYNTAGTYDVSLTVTDDNGNDTETKVGYITVVAAPNAGSSTSENLCNNTTLDLNTLIPGADPGTWVETSGTPSGQFNAGTGVLDGNGLPVGNVYTFDYTVTGTAPCNDATSTMTITIIDCSGGAPPTAAFSTTNTTICEGDCIDFTDMSTLGTNPTWSWTFTGANTPTSSAQNPTNICYDVAGTYTVELTVTDDNGTDTHTEVNYITVNPTPTVTATASPNDTICTGDQVTLTGGGAVTYVWDNGVTDGVPFTPAGTTTYTVVGTDANGCSRNNFITVVVESCDTLSANWTVSSLNVCVGDCIQFTDQSTGNIASWEWTFGGGGTPDTVLNNPNPVVCFNSPGSFTVNLQVSNTGGTSDYSQVINVVTGAQVTATLDTIIDLGGTATLMAAGAGPGSYSWYPPTLVACDTCATTTASPNSSTDFIVTLTDSNGCTGQDTVMVLVNFVEGIDVPTAFSPNGDGNNDILYVKGVGIEAMTFTIYNRYGQKVFESDNQLIGWDGTFRNRPENSGVFTWMLEYHLINGTTGVLKGNTTLVR